MSTDEAPTSQPAAPTGKKKVFYKGSLSREEIEGTLRTVKNQVRFCYEERLKDQPELRGQVIMRFVIAGSGEVASAEAQADPGMEDVGSCTTQVVQRLKFPSPRGGGKVIVNYPYRFSPEKKAAKPSDDAAANEASSSGDDDNSAESSLPPPDEQPATAEEPSYFSKCCGCIP